MNTAATANVSTTCQICERAIKLVRGKIALHGYQRPGTGWQSASCEGARALPWQLSCDALALHVDAIRAQRDRVHVIATGPVLSLSLQVGFESHHSSVPKMVRVTEETLASVAAEHPKFARYNGASFYAAGPLPWANLVERFRTQRRAEIAQLDQYLARQQARLDGWQPQAE